MKNSPFLASLKASERPKLWVPSGGLTLMLDSPEGIQSVFKEWYCPTTGQYAHNVAHYKGGSNGSSASMGRKEGAAQ